MLNHFDIYVKFHWGLFIKCLIEDDLKCRLIQNNGFPCSVG